MNNQINYSDLAIKDMIAPGIRRPGKYRQGVIQIWITRACDKSCYGCTQGSNLGGKLSFITLEQFEQACLSLKDYFGVVGVFGGNPALHPDFEELCRIMRIIIPYERRGIWSNHPKGNGKIMRETFNPSISNLNVHLDKCAYDEFKRDWPECTPVGLSIDSRHSPPYVAIKDVIHDEYTMWNMIKNCDINIHWSAMIGVFRGQLRGYFCEIAGSQAMLHQHEENYPDTGLEVNEDWWKYPIEYYSNQIKKHCVECGIPLKGYGELAQNNDIEAKEQVSKTHESIFITKKKDRRVELVMVKEQLGKSLYRVTDYLSNSSK